MGTAAVSPSLALPVELAARGLALRPEIEGDYPFLERLYLSVRWEELAQSGWPEQVKLDFLRHQFSLQFRHYATYYGGTAFGILESDGKPIGRWYVFRSSEDLRVVDVSLLPEWRAQGIATALFDQLLAEAGDSGRTVSIHVEKFNPAQNLYRRLGFREAGESGPYWLMVWRPQGHGNAICKETSCSTP